MMADHGSELFARKVLPLRLRPGLAAWFLARDRAGLGLAGGGAPTAGAARTQRSHAQDIGITRADAEREASRPFWDPGQERWRDLR